MQNRSNLPSGAYSMQMHEGRGYLVYNKISSIYLLDGKTFAYSGKIIDSKLENCRQFMGINADKAYVSCWGNTNNPSVAVVNLNSGQVLQNIPTGKNPENILLDDSYAYVANTDDQTITVINTETDLENPPIQVNSKPVGMAVDRNGRLWVLCNGDPASLVSINLRNLASVPLTFPLEQKPTAQFKNLAINRNRDVLYFTMTRTDSPQEGGLFQFAITDKVSEIKLNRPADRHQINQMSIDPRSNILLAATTPESPSKGYVLRYKLPSATGAVSLADSIPVFSKGYKAIGFAIQP